jgi:carbonic anhydrase
LVYWQELTVYLKSITKKFQTRLIYKKKGPTFWNSNYPIGNHQSPINIEETKTKFNSYLAENPLNLHFDKDCFTYIENTGTSFKVSGLENSISSKTHRFFSNWKLNTAVHYRKTPQTCPGTILTRNFFPQIWSRELAAKAS